MRSVPNDGALDAELAALRARAYGADADIERDPAAVARLAELEEWHAFTTARDEQGAPSRRTGDAPSDEACATSGERGAGTSRDPPQNGALRVRRENLKALALGAGVASGIALAIGGLLLWAAPKPYAVLHPITGPPTDQVLRLADYARSFLVDESTLHGFQPFRDLSIWSASSSLGNTCLLVFEPSTDNFLGASCVPPPAEPTVEIYDVPIYALQDWHEGLDVGAMARFVRNGEDVEVWLYDGRPLP
jgi:hypothetical protein